jgi:hypothetical protein
MQEKKIVHSVSPHPAQSIVGLYVSRREDETAVVSILIVGRQVLPGSPNVTNESQGTAVG